MLHVAASSQNTLNTVQVASYEGSCCSYYLKSLWEVIKNIFHFLTCYCFSEAPSLPAPPASSTVISTAISTFTPLPPPSRVAEPARSLAGGTPAAIPPKPEGYEGCMSEYKDFRDLSFSWIDLRNDGIGYAIERQAATFHPRMMSLGVYGNDYDFTIPVVAIKLPPHCLQAFPREVRERFQGLNPDQIDLSFIIHRDVSQSTRYRNLVTHAVVHPSCPRNEEWAEAQISMGIFDMQGVRTSATNQEHLFPNGFYPMPVIIHPVNGRLAFSPNNCLLEIENTPDGVSTFVTAMDMRQPTIAVRAPQHMQYENRAVACFHVVAQDNAAIFNQINNNFSLEALSQHLPPLRNILCMNV